MKNTVLSLCSCFLFLPGNSQVTNNNYKQGLVNVALPKTPESQAFEKYGNIGVSELTGSPNISVPIYTLKSRFLEVPITLSYNATGIRVNQEASWVGLGFDLIAGGRITVETKGCVDNDGISPNLFSPTLLKNGMQKIFSRLGNSRDVSVLTYASTCWNCVDNPIPDDHDAVNAMAQFGLGEPDEFHVNFLGNSFTFYFDKITDDIKFIGEKSLFKIDYQKDAFQRITSWTLTDNMGTKYFFDQVEITEMLMPPMGALTGNAPATSAWLLTKIQHSSGDEINFTYTNYGNSYPVHSWTSSASHSEGEPPPSSGPSSPPDIQNEVIQHPNYLTKIETADIAVEFTLDSRDDLKGSGSKKLTDIKIIDKQSNAVKKKVVFDYDYFVGVLGDQSSALTQEEKNYRQLRLKLNSISLNALSANDAPYKFYYNNGVGIPDKYSFAIDHWGYNNLNLGTYFIASSPKNLIPNTGAETIDPDLIGYASSREPYAPAMVCMTMDSIVYPTGGSTKLIFEPHNASVSGVYGGGLRIKSMRNYSLSRLTGIIDYSYESGVYMGTIQYHTKIYSLPVCEDIDHPAYPLTHTVSANGAINDNDMLVAYRTVTKTQRDLFGNTLGYVLKNFHVPNPRQTSGGYGFDVLGAHWPSGTIPDPVNQGQWLTFVNGTDFLYPNLSGFPPTPTRHLDGKLMEEKYFDNSNTLKKSINYYYSQADYSQNFYSIRVRDTRKGGADASIGGCEGIGAENDGSARRYIIYVSPAKSFYTLTDSVVEKNFEGNQVLVNRKLTQYNQYYQPETEISYNSDGTQTISKVKTSLMFKNPNYFGLNPTAGDTYDIQELLSNHIYDLPVEQTMLKKYGPDDIKVIGSQFVQFKKTLPQKIYRLENVKPLSLGSEFIPSFNDYLNYPNTPAGSDYTVKKDVGYKLQNEITYSAQSQITDVKSIKGSTGYIWDKYHNNLIAQCTNALSGDIAFTSFESIDFGNWNVSNAGISSDATAPTGEKVYSLSSANITALNLNSTKTYFLSYWSKSGAKNVNGTFGLPRNSANGWTYYEHTVANPSTGTITISGSGVIDELRLYPKGSIMTTYAYDPVFGLTSQCDANSRISYYEYDESGRVLRIRDEQKNIIKQFEYKYLEQFNFPYSNVEKTSSASITCSPGYSPIVYPYVVPAGKYGSFLSQQDADQKAQQDVDANGQAWANATGICNPEYAYTSCCNYTTPGVSFALAGNNTVEFSMVLIHSPGSAMGQIGTLTGPPFLPTQPRTIQVAVNTQYYPNAVFTLQILPTGEVRLLNGPVNTHEIPLSGSYQLTN